MCQELIGDSGYSVVYFGVWDYSFGTGNTQQVVTLANLENYKHVQNLKIHRHLGKGWFWDSIQQVF